MKIIRSTDLSDYGNDCYIHKSITLFEEFGLYFIITTEKVSGWSEKEEITCHPKITKNLEEASILYSRLTNKCVRCGKDLPKLSTGYKCFECTEDSVKQIFEKYPEVKVAFEETLRKMQSEISNL